MKLDEVSDPGPYFGLILGLFGVLLDPTLRPMNDPTPLHHMMSQDLRLRALDLRGAGPPDLGPRKGLNLGSKTTHFGSFWGHSGGQDSSRIEARSGIASRGHVLSQVTGYGPEGPCLQHIVLWG